MKQHVQLWTPNNHSQWQITYAREKQPTPEAEHVVAVIGREYGGLVGNVNGPERLRSKEEDSSRNWIVYGTQQDVHVKEILRFRGLERQKREEKQQRTLDTIISVTQHLLARGVKTIPTIYTMTGKPYVLEGDMPPILVAPFISGWHCQGTEKQLAAFAAELGKIHSAMRAFPKEKLSCSEYVELKFDPALLGELKEKNRVALSAPTPHQIEHVAFEMIQLLEERLPGTIEQLRTYKYEPGITMGDLHPHDTLYVGDELQMVFDWEKTSFGYPVMEELAFSLHRFIRQAMVWNIQEKKDQVTYGDVRKMRDTFLCAYAQSIPITINDTAALPVLITKTNAHKALRILSYHYGLARDSMERTTEKLRSELVKFLIHLKEAAYFGNSAPE